MLRRIAACLPMLRGWLDGALKGSIADGPLFRCCCCVRVASDAGYDDGADDDQDDYLAMSGQNLP